VVEGSAYITVVQPARLRRRVPLGTLLGHFGENPCEDGPVAWLIASDTLRRVVGRNNGRTCNESDGEWKLMSDILRSYCDTTELKTCQVTAHLAYAANQAHRLECQEKAIKGGIAAPT